MTNLRTAGTLLVLLSLIACGSNPKQEEDLVVDTEQQRLDAVVKPVTIDGVQDFSSIDPNSIAGRAPLERVIYFDYDQAELRPEYLSIVAQHGRFLAENTDGQVRLEGHTDERGTREYNIALGEARAKTIARMLQLQGVNPDQMRTVSYGEELPVDDAHNNDAWAKNRRVNIIYEIAVQN
ncbi:MAG: peptidoglycan-associated lipoprotein Pal [Granulosicoccus sp.]|nr:peptidoglycan-associated lipoprotein Pal [Granulosicoccus sp.]